MATHTRKTQPRGRAGAFAYEGLDRALHEKARLGIMTALLTRPEGLRFGELRQLCSLTDGNLNRHLHVLREAALVEIWKGHEGRRPQTLVRLSKGGREQFLSYIEELERIVEAARTESARARRAGDALPPGWVPA